MTLKHLTVNNWPKERLKSMVACTKFFWPLDESSDDRQMMMLILRLMMITMMMLMMELIMKMISIRNDKNSGHNNYNGNF